jgi:sugar porter (SP) family MFS transporter
LGGFLVEALGRKWAMIVLAPPMIAGWLVIAFAPSPAVVLVGRFITGLCGGCFTMVCPVYISELAENKLRGLLSNVVALFIVSGILWTYVIGALVNWKILSMINAALPIVFGVGMFFQPESPRYLLAKGKDKEARQALKRLRGADTEEQIEPEIKIIEASIEEANSQSASFKDLMTGQILKPTGVSFMLMFLQQFGGINAVLFYCVAIFQAAGTGMSENLSAIIVAVVQVVFAFVSLILVERLGRKLLLLISELGMALCLIVLGVFFYIKEHEPVKADSLGWLPLVSLIIYMVAYNVGAGPLPWTMMGELMPPHVKGMMSSAASAFCWGLAFLITKFFNNMLIALTSYGCYWLFSGFCVFGFAFCFFLVPETKGKSLDEIQKLYAKK